jgi:predicted kinase
MDFILTGDSGSYCNRAAENSYRDGGKIFTTGEPRRNHAEAIPGILPATGRRLLPHAPVCYKRYMRKWMSERLKRRKKPGDGAKETTKELEPLQPKFYDNEPAAAVAVPVEAATVEAPVVQSRRTARQEPESEAEPASVPATVPGAVESRPRTARRRRSRGGRGRSRTASAPPARLPALPSAIEPSAAESSVPEPAPVVKELAPSLPSSSATPRPSKGTVVLAIGLPGSGKSSWFKRHNIHPLSSDLLRELLFDDAQEQRFQDLVFSNLRSMLKARLVARRPMNYVDATNLTPHDRSSWIKLAKDYGYDVQGVFFDVPLEVCMERHQRRGRAVAEDIMRKMAGKLKPPTFDEGFSKITVVRVKHKEG